MNIKNIYNIKKVKKMYYENDLIYDLITGYQAPKEFLEGFDPNTETLSDYCAEVVRDMRKEMLPECELSNEELTEGMVVYLDKWIEETHYLKVDPHTGKIKKKEKERILIEDDEKLGEIELPFKIDGELTEEQDTIIDGLLDDLFPKREYSWRWYSGDPERPYIIIVEFQDKDDLDLTRWEYFLVDEKFGDDYLSRDDLFTSKESIAIQAIRYFNRLEHNDMCSLYRFRKNRIEWYHPDTNESGKSISLNGNWESVNPRGPDFEDIKKKIESTLSIEYSIKISI